MMPTVRVAYTKWGGRPHWEFDTTLLGEDAHGVWLAMPVGTLMARPGLEVLLECPSVLLVPRDEPFTAMFMQRAQEDGNPSVLYIDVTTVPSVAGAAVTAVDLDLDVVRLRDGSVLLDDEDEFEEHQVSYGYPVETVALARATAGRLVRDVARRAEPFGQAAEAWLAGVTSPH